MALRTDASGDILSRSSALTITSFTLMGWNQVVSNRGAMQWQSLAGAQVSSSAYIGWGWSSNDTGSTSELGSWNGSTWTSVFFGSRPAVGDWFHWYLKCAGTGANQLEAGWKRLQDANYVTATTTLGSGITGTASALVGNDPNFDFWGDMRHAALKGYSGALSAADIERERLTIAPQSTTNLLFWVPMVDATVADSVKDFGGAGANFTAGGTLTVQDGPPIQFRQGRRRIIIPAAVAGNIDISPAAAQIVLSRTAPTAVQDIRRDIPQGNLALSSVAPSVSVSAATNISPAAAQIVLSRTAPTVLQDIRRNTPQGNIVLSSTAPSVSVSNNLNISPAAAQLVISRTAPGVVQNIRRDTPQGNLVLSSAAPSVVQTTSANISPAAAQLAFSSVAPGVSAGAGSNLSPAAAQLALSAAAPTIKVDVRRDIPQGNLTLTSAAPTVARTDHRNISPAAAQLTFSSVAPGVQAGGSVGLQPAAKQLVISTAAPTVTATANVAVSPAAAQLSLSSVAPSRITDFRRDIPQGNVVLSSAAPSVNVSSSQGVSPAAGNLVLTGTAPTVKIDFRVSPAAAQLVISRSAPALVQDKPRDVPAGQLAITATAPSVSVTGHSYLYPAAVDLLISGLAPSVTVASTEPPRTDRSSRDRITNNVGRTPALSHGNRPAASTERRRNVA